MMRALQTFAAGRQVVAEGQKFPDDHPMVKGREQLFEPVPEAEPKPKPTRRRKATSGDPGDT